MNLTSIQTRSKALSPPVDDLTVWLRRARKERFLIETIVTPELAGRLLMLNPENRTLSQNTVDTYAGNMRRGEWRLNGEPIIIAATGEVNDGQHRLCAVVQSECDIVLSIYFGIDRASRSTIDTGRKRTMGDHLAMLGEVNVNWLAPAVAFVWHYDQHNASFKDHPSVGQTRAALDANPGIRAAVNAVSSLKRPFRLMTGMMAGAYYVCHRVSPDTAYRLLEGTATGVGIPAENSPISRLRQRYQDHITGIKLLSRYEGAAAFIKAFNALRLGRNMKVNGCSWLESGPDAQPFPRAGN